jgi:2-iminobutanoate/2-iminopropanoate deaminase
MAITTIHTASAPKAIGPYSQAVKSGSLLFVSGQIAINPASGEVELFDGDVGKQTGRALTNLQAILNEAGLNFQDVVKTTVYLTSMGSFAAMNEVYASFFGSFKPARATVEVSALPANVAVEVEAIASFD